MSTGKQRPFADPVRRLAEAIADSLLRSGEETADCLILRKGNKDVGRLGRVPAAQWITAVIERDAREETWMKGVSQATGFLTPSLRRAMAQTLAFDLMQPPPITAFTRHGVENELADRIAAAIDQFLDVYAPDEVLAPEEPQTPDAAEAPSLPAQKKGGRR